VLTHPMLDQLGQLGLSGMAQAFAELEAADETAALTHADWLGLLVDRELIPSGHCRGLCSVRLIFCDGPGCLDRFRGGIS